LQICREAGWPNNGLKKQKQETVSSLREAGEVLFRLLVIKGRKKEPKPKDARHQQ